jgi:RsiW-degrading membrane proteinase PrsW (M82 family)
MATPDDGRCETLWVLIGLLFLGGVVCAFILAQACVSVHALTTMESQMATRLKDAWAPGEVFIILLKVILSPLARFFGVPL